jgi:hypothetical protein
MTVYLDVEQINTSFRKELVNILAGNPGKITVHFVLKDKGNKMAVKLFSVPPDRSDTGTFRLDTKEQP